MRCALLTRLTACLHASMDGGRFRPVKQFIHTIDSLPQDDLANHDRRDTPDLPGGANGGGKFMRRMMIAAAIASGLIALWVAMLPLAA